MKRFLLAVALALLAQAAMAGHTVRLRETVSVDILGATSAFAVNPDIAQVTAVRGVLTITGRQAGRTQVVVVTPHGQSTYEVVVVAPAPLSKKADGDGSITGSYEVRYNSAPQQLQTSVSAVRQTEAARTEVQVQTIKHGRDRVGDQSSVSVPSAWVRVFRRDSELTLFDRYVDNSALTVSGTTLRGVHYLNDRWRFHAGTTSYTLFQSFLLPTEPELAVGASYVSAINDRSGLMTSVYAFPRANEQRGGNSGAVGAIAYDYKPSELLSARAEVAWGGTLGAAGTLSYESRRDRVRLDIRYQPRTFASLGTVAPGFFADGLWNTRFGSRWAADFNVSANDYDLAHFQQRALNASAETRYAATDRLTILTGARYGEFSRPGTTSTRSFVIPAGLHIQLPRFSAGTIYRYSRNSSSNEGGHGIRINARASMRSIFASAYVDHETQAPTLDLVFRESPELALAMAQLGITATTTEDIARALRENAALIAQGFIEGVTIDLAPSRTQAGLEIGWTGDSAWRRQLRLRLLLNRNEGIDFDSSVTIASLSWSQRLTASSDFVIGYSHWTTTAGDIRHTEPILELSVRQRFDSLSALPSLGTGTISGLIFLDEDLDGKPDAPNAVVENADVQLDGDKTTRTDANGAFAFRNVARGTHKIVARLTSHPQAYFTTPSRLEAKTGKQVHFGVSYTPARLLGTVRNDVGDGVAGVSLIATRGDRQIAEATTSSGKASMAVPPGEWEIGITPESVPAGYSLEGVASKTVTLERGKPLDVEFVLKANRSISGQVANGKGAEVILEPGEKRLTADDEGRYSFRALAPGSYTVVTKIGDVRLTREVVVPRGPVMLTNIDLASTTAPVVIATITTKEIGERHGQMYTVQLGAYRQRENARITAQRARAAGFDAKMIESASSLTIVRVGGFASAADAAATAAQVKRAGLEAAVVSVR